MKLDLGRIALQVVGGSVLLSVGAFLSACGGGGDDATERQRTAGKDARVAGADEETQLQAEVANAEDQGQGLALSAASLDYEITVRCKFGGQQLEKIYSAAEFASGAASMPKGSTDCYGFPSEVRVGPSPEKVFVPQAAIGPQSFNNYTVDAVMTYVESPAPAAGATTEAIVRLAKAMPRTLSDDAAALSYEIDLRVRQEVLAIASNVALDQSKLGATVKGQNPPALAVELANFLSIASTQPSDKKECDYLARVTCSKNPVADAAGRLKSCDGVDLADLKWEFVQPGLVSPRRLMSASDVTRTATGATLPITIGCDRTGGSATQVKTGLALRVFNTSAGNTNNHSSIAFPFTLTINFSVFP
jgi:hypothetical protein